MSKVADAHPASDEESESSDDEEDLFLDILVDKIRPGSSNAQCMKLWSAVGTFFCFVSGVGACLAGLWLVMEIEDHSSQMEIYDKMDPETDFERIHPGCNINLTKHEYVVVAGSHNHASKKTDPSRCYDKYFYTVTDLSSGSEWPSAAQSTSRSCGASTRANSSFAGTLPTQTVPCWRAKRLPAPVGYICGNEKCVKISDPAHDYAARDPITSNRDTALTIFLPCIICSVLLWLLLCWGPDRCNRIKRCQCCNQCSN